MAVLVQQLVPAEYAFVIHTVNPTTGDSNESLAEVVLGLGETLVGNHPGRALGCACSKPSGDAEFSYRLLSYPSKSVALRGRGLIFRSDSNGEDLPGYAGAGLYDTVTLEPPQEELIDYSGEPLVWDAAFRRYLLQRISQAGQILEAACGTPQDIEGAFAHGELYVVQTRPQVGIRS
jgi:alpha-glucan,water dikinase